MMAAREHLAAAFAVFERDARIFASYRVRSFSQLFTIIFSLALFHYLSKLISVASFPSHQAYFAFVVVGLVILEIIQATFQLPSVLYQEMVAGNFERMAVSPFGPLRSVFAMALFPMTLTFFMSSLTLIVAAGVFGMHIAWSTAPLAIPIGLLASLSFVPISLFFCAMVTAFKSQTGSTYVLSGVAFISGLYFPVSYLPSWIRWASRFQPVTPSVDLLRHVIAGLPLTRSAGIDLLTILLFIGVMLPVSALVLQSAFTYGRRRGTLMEY